VSGFNVSGELDGGTVAELQGKTGVEWWVLFDDQRVVQLTQCEKPVSQ
jgi:hypothetical protein